MRAEEMPSNNTPVEIAFPDGSTRVLKFDDSMNVKEITVTDRFNNIILSCEYGYDERGNIISKKTGSGDYKYVYDGLSRLTEVLKGDRSIERYAYDGFGNRLICAKHNDWEYGPDNELLSYGSTKFTYDAWGNTVRMATQGGIQSYIYDAKNRLIEVRDGRDGLKARYGYDDQGRRIRKEVFNPPLTEPVEMSAQFASSTSKITNYVYSEEGLLIGEYNLEGKAITTWFYDPYSSIPAEPLFMVHRCNKYVFHNDHLGTPQKITDAEGKVVWSATYDAFGNAESDPGSTITSNLRFPGQYYDSETGLHYNIHRYYNPATGRYLSKDPLKVVAEGSNVYSYANANPLKFCDPLGLYSWYGHHLLFEKQFPRLRLNFLNALKKGSDDVDTNQRIEDSYMHAQWNPEQPIFTALEEIKRFIMFNLNKMNSLKTSEDFEFLGAALHTIQDSSCPQHALQFRRPVFYLDGAICRWRDFILYDSYANRICKADKLYELRNVIFEPLRYDGIISLSTVKHAFREQFNDMDQSYERYLRIIDNLEKEWRLEFSLVRKVMEMTSAVNTTDNEYTIETEAEKSERRAEEGLRRAKMS